MVRVSVIRVREGSGLRRVRKNWQTMNQFVQVTLLTISSYTESVKTELILIIRIPGFYTHFCSEPLNWLQYINILAELWIPHRDCVLQMWTNESSIKDSQGCWWSMLLKTTILPSCFWADILNMVRPREVRKNQDSKIPIYKQIHAQAQSISHRR